MDLAGGDQGTLATTTFRGAGYTAQTSASNIVAFYVNDAPAEANTAIQNTYDIGQIEVLRGTQGTLRGQSAPSGAITVTTRRPDLQQFGDYAQEIFTDDDGVNMQGALNIPIVSNMLALRIAGLVDENEGNGVRSVNNSSSPRIHSEAIRGGLLFEPTPNLSFNLTFEDLDRSNRTFSALTGPAALGNAAISPSDQLTIAHAPNTSEVDVRRYIANADWDLGGATISHVGSSTDFTNFSSDPNSITNPAAGSRDIDTSSESASHELRLTSNEPLGGLFDYVVGAFMTRSDSQTALAGLAAFATFGEVNEDSICGNLNFHLGERTELSLGARYLEQESVGNLPALASLLPNPSTETSRTLWSASISHDLTDNVMVYASAGTAMRFTNPAIVGLGFFAALGQPDLTPTLFLPPEESENYEIGLKGNFIDGRLLVNVALFRQEFGNFIFLTPSAAYDLNSTSEGTDTSAANFVWPVDAVIEGVDFDATLRVTDYWTVGGAVSYADGQADNAQTPCNDAHGDGIADGGRPTGFDDAGPFPSIVTCAYSGPLASTPNWNATLQSEISFPAASSMEGFVRGFYNYYPENENGSNPSFTTDAYGLLNLFAGVRSPNGAWEIMAFARNVLDDDTELTRGSLSRRAQPIFRVPSINLKSSV